MKEKITFTEKDMLQDCLYSQKQISAAYNEFASETTSKQLRTSLLNILEDEQKYCAEISGELQTRGISETKEAGASEIIKAKQKYLNDM